MTDDLQEAAWKSLALIIARLIFAAVFAMAVTFKILDINGTATYIATAGFPLSLVLAILAAILEVALVIAFLTGAFFREACLVAAVYVLFLGFAFHGPSHWAGNQAEFGFFIDHWTFFAGLLVTAAYGPGRWMAWRRGMLK